MKLMKWLITTFALVILTACSDDSQQIEAIDEDTKVGFEMANGTIEEAQNLPAEEKEALINAFNQYIEAFNAQDIDTYMSTLSSKPKGFELDEEREAVLNAFNTYTVNRQAKDVTVVKYNETEANVFANLSVNLVEKETESEHSSDGRQITVFTKENNVWKVSSVYYIGNEE